MTSRNTAPPEGYSSRPPRHLPNGVYCSPWCGFGCTKAAHDRAQKEGAELAARMGADWSALIWENCGWHYSAVKGVAKITVTKTGSPTRGDWTVTGYTGSINTSPQFIARAATPEDALGFAVQEARTSTRRIADALADILNEEGAAR